MGIVSITPGRRSLSLLALSLITVCGFSQADEPRSTVADLRYGAALYEYYQGKHFEALSELMVADTRGGIEGHDDNPQLIEGGISLSFGMEEKAGELFTELLSADANGEFSRPLEVRNAAWFYLAKLRYLRGDWDGTEESLNRIDGRFDRELLPELEATAINLAIRRDDLESAEAQLGKLRYADDHLHYIYYNLGNAYSRAGQFEQADEYYRRLAKLPVSELPKKQEEQLAVYDKAMTSAGYSRIMQGQHEEAIDAFSQVRLDSPFSRRALLGYGWAAAETGDYRSALRPWQDLSERALIYAPVQEALIAVPYAYEQLGAEGQALQSYLDAESAFQSELDRIDGIISQVDQLDVLSALNISDTDNRNWFLLDETSGAKPHLSYLAELFSLNHFQGAVQELRDLLHMAGRLREWRQKLDAYEAMLQQREINRGSQLDDIAERNLRSKLQQMMATRDRLNGELERIAEEGDYLALVNNEEKELLDRVRSAEERLARLKAAGESTEEYDAQLARYRGLLFWEASQQFPKRQWAVRRRVGELDDAILEARTNLDRLQRVIDEAPDIEPYRARMAALSERLDTQTRRLNAALDLAESSLRGKVREELVEQRQRLQHYMAQARLSVARLYDLAAEEQRP